MVFLAFLPLAESGVRKLGDVFIKIDIEKLLDNEFYCFLPSLTFLLLLVP